MAVTDVEVVQDTTYPWDGAVTLTGKPRAATRLAVRIRLPKRDVSALYRATPAGDGIGRITVNGNVVTPDVVNGYATITRTWKAGDTIAFMLPMPIQRVYGSQKIVSGDDRPSPVGNKVALRRGPLVYNIEQVDQDIQGVLDPAAPLAADWRGDLLGGVTVITGRFAGGSPLLAIPNYAACARHLAWGYVDHPPLAPFVLRVATAIGGEHLVVLRLIVSALAALTVAGTGLLAWRLGAGRFGQGLAAAALLFAPVAQVVFGVYSMNAFELLIWLALSWLLVELVSGASRPATARPGRSNGWAVHVDSRRFTRRPTVTTRGDHRHVHRRWPS